MSSDEKRDFGRESGEEMKLIWRMDKWIGRNEEEIEEGEEKESILKKKSIDEKMEWENEE